MSSSRALLFGVLGFRIAYGAALIAVPDRVTRRWLGDTANQAGGRVALGALGAREVVVHREPGPSGYADVQRLPWTTPLEVPVAPPIPVDLAELLADL